ncbi:MAG: Fatty acid degradation regulator YsiA, TetR family [Labilithrix sp.]|nr:Fatty acid degradation regulator YsiA, TetR family [Labilithrix sp.]
MSESSLSLRRAGRAANGRKPKDSADAARSGGSAARTREDAAREREERTAAKKRRSRDKRDRILKAAVKVFARNGFHATRVSEVAKAAGVADGTIYLYFKSKEELLVSLFEDRVSKLLAFMMDSLPKLSSAPERLRAVIDMQLGLLEGERDLAEVVTVIIRQSTRLMKEFAAPKFLAYLDAIAKIVQEGQAAGDFRQDISPHIAARAVFGALDGITLTWALGRAEQGALARAATQLADVLLRGLAPT